jgi:DNA-binding LacI/PurR family transcriptional regulator
MDRPTIREVAEHAKVSTQTVSRVINGSSLVTSQTRERVLETIAKLGFEPNHAAQSLVTKRTRTLAYLVYDITNPFYGQLVRGIEDAAFTRGYDLIGGNSDAAHEKDLMYLRTFSRKRVDGILATVSYPSRETFKIWQSAVCPVVFLDYFFAGEECSYVTVNNREAARGVVNHLLDLGHSRIAIVTPPSPASASIRERVEGYYEALAERGLPFDPSLAASCERQTEDGGYKATRELFARSTRQTALFCFNDAIAIGAMRAILEMGLAIPGDVSIVGYDDVPISSMLRVPLTTVAQPIRRMGEAAVELLTERIAQGPSSPHRHIILDTKLIIRESTAHPRI